MRYGLSHPRNGQWPPRLGALITVILPLSLNIWGPPHCIGYGESFSPNYFWDTSTDGLNCGNRDNDNVQDQRKLPVLCTRREISLSLYKGKIFQQSMWEVWFSFIKRKKICPRQQLTKSLLRYEKDIQNQGGWDSTGHSIRGRESCQL